MNYRTVFDILTFPKPTDDFDDSIALWKGDERTRTVQINVDGTSVTTWTSSGTTAGLETIDLAGASGQVLEVVAVASSSSEWLSIIEVCLPSSLSTREAEMGLVSTPNFCGLQAVEAHQLYSAVVFVGVPRCLCGCP